MNRRDFLNAIGAAGVAAWVPGAAFAQRSAGGYANLLVLVELKGGNDGLNTVVPYADGDYYALRPRLAIPREQVLQLDAHTGLHPALEPLMSLWKNRELAVVQGVGYPSANLSHFRSIEIWDTASKSSEYLSEGWLARAFAAAPTPRSFAADGVIVGGAEMGPFAGGTRAIALTDTAQFLRQARLAAPAGAGTQRRAHPHTQGRAGHRAGGGQFERRARLRHRIPAHAVRQRHPHGGAGHSQRGGGRRGEAFAQRLRHAQQSTRYARAPAQGSRRRPYRASGSPRRDSGDGIRRS